MPRESKTPFEEAVRILTEGWRGLPTTELWERLKKEHPGLRYEDALKLRRQYQKLCWSYNLNERKKEMVKAHAQDRDKVPENMDDRPNSQYEDDAILQNKSFWDISMLQDGDGWACVGVLVKKGKNVPERMNHVPCSLGRIFYLKPSNESKLLTECPQLMALVIASKSNVDGAITIGTLNTKKGYDRKIEVIQQFLSQKRPIYDAGPRGRVSHSERLWASFMDWRTKVFSGKDEMKFRNFYAQEFIFINNRVKYQKTKILMNIKRAMHDLLERQALDEESDSSRTGSIVVPDLKMGALNDNKKISGSIWENLAQFELNFDVDDC